MTGPVVAVHRYAWRPFVGYCAFAEVQVNDHTTVTGWFEASELVLL